MKTKLEVAKKIMRSGQLMNISNGWSPNVIRNVTSAENTGTWFFQTSLNKSLGSKKRWLLHNPHVVGHIRIDAGAKQAILNSSSLLAVGVKNVKSHFSKDDIVLIEEVDSHPFAKGIASLNSKELKKEKHGIEIVHRDNLVIL